MRTDDDNLRSDVNQTAFNVVRGATGEGKKPIPPDEREEPNPTAAERGRKGGRKGGKARAEKLTEEQRAEIAGVAASARWKKGK